jgi:Flp pilus assembly protein TadB
MSVHIPTEQLQQRAEIVGWPALGRNRADHVFDLHPAVHVGLAALYLAFAGILTTAFMAREMIVPAVIVFVGIVGLLGTPALWARVVPDDGTRKQSWAEFLHERVETITGRLTAGQALAQSSRCRWCSSASRSPW